MKFVIIFLLSFQAQAQSFNNKLNTDQQLQSYIKKFRLRAASKPAGFIKAKFDLGRELFFDKKLSGNKDISCSTCHQPQLGTSDALPLPIGVTGKGIGKKRLANGAPIIARHSPHLFNLADKSFMFWDGRVSFDGFEFKTPEPGLNGEYPLFKEIVKNLDSALAAQALFPPTSVEEMRGINNPFSNAKTNLELWNLIMKRLLSTQKYQKLFAIAFPNESDFNIGHLGNAIAHYESHQFSVTQTPWDKYLRGDQTALDSSAKQGAIIFLTKGSCITCHTGSDFGGSSFHNIASPQIGPGKDIQHNDEGRFYVTGFEADRYKFKTPSLKNVAKSAPYFHSGAYQTLDEVITHYNFGPRSIDVYNDYWLKEFEEFNYDKALFVERNPYMIFRKKDNSHPLIRTHQIRLTEPEKKNLLNFIKYSLTD